MSEDYNNKNENELEGVSDKSAEENVSSTGEPVKESDFSQPSDVNTAEETTEKTEAFSQSASEQPRPMNQQAEPQTNDNNCSYHYSYQPNEKTDAFSAQNGGNSQNTNGQQAQGNQYSSYNSQQNAYNAYNSQNQQNGQYGAYNGNQPYGSQPTNPYNFGGNQYRQPYQAPAQQRTPNTPPKKSGKGKVVALVVVIAVVVIAVAATIIKVVPKGIGANASTTNASEATSSQQTSGANHLQYATTDKSNLEALSAVEVAEKARDSVVGIMTYKDGQLSGEGSGVVMGVDETGKYTYIITCAHVISGKGLTYGVGTLDGRKYEAKLVAYDTRTDIGVLMVEATDIKAAEFGDSSSLKVGETVYAIGNPGGSEYFGSMTNGIVSAIDRSVSGTYTMTCIQHNAAINPGNSGGALVNSAGQVIGINSSKIAATDYEGMGFAIPIATVKTIVDALIDYGYVPNRPKLGIQYASVDNYQLYSMVVAIKGLPAGSLVIAKISEDSSLANTQAQVGDLITAVNGKKMDSSNVLLDLIDTGAVGDKITLTLCRVNNRSYQTSEFDVTVTLIEDKGTEAEEETTEPTLPNDGGSDLEDFFRRYFGQ